jgi:hypothetical protein
LDQSELRGSVHTFQQYLTMVCATLFTNVLEEKFSEVRGTNSLRILDAFIASIVGSGKGWPA